MPQKTEYPKILKLKNLDFTPERLNGLLEELMPVCQPTDANGKYDSEKYRNRDYLLKILCREFSSLREFYKK